MQESEGRSAPSSEELDAYAKRDSLVLVVVVVVVVVVVGVG